MTQIPSADSQVAHSSATRLPFLFLIRLASVGAMWHYHVRLLTSFLSLSISSEAEGIIPVAALPPAIAPAYAKDDSDKD